MDSERQQQLLRRFEPIMHYSRGEQFFPMRVEPYVRSCSLWVQHPDQDPERLIGRGALTLKDLSEPRLDEFGTVYFLKLTRPVAPPQMAAYNLQRLRQRLGITDSFFAGRSRLARVGYTSRLVDALFSLTLLARGRVPGDAALAAEEIYQQTLAQSEAYAYYGRVISQDSWVVVQYWFFYAYNNWRSGFFGANDHEADWEMITIYLSQSETGELKPEWVAYAAHDFSGDDLRRRWDDPELEKVGEHPVVYPAAGSHASYFRAGEYLTEFEIPFLAPLNKIGRRLQSFWQETLRQYGSQDLPSAPERETRIFHIPFVDYARGDGLSIGPGQDREWQPVTTMEPPPTWTVYYRGLWGLYTHDPLAGENAPAGPMYNRDGSVRRSWYDPVGWAGLDKVVPFTEIMTVLREEQANLAAEEEELKDKVDETGRELQRAGVEMAAMQRRPHLDKMYQQRQKQIETASRELDRLRAQLADRQALSQSLKLYAERIEAGERPAPRAHIRHFRQPTTDSDLRFGRLAEMWAAVSVGVMLIGSVLLAFLARGYFAYWLIASVSVLILIETSLRGNLTRLITRLTVGLAIACTLVIIYEFFWTLLALIILVIGVYILWDNVRELHA